MVEEGRSRRAARGSTHPLSAVRRRSSLLHVDAAANGAASPVATSRVSFAASPQSAHVFNIQQRDDVEDRRQVQETAAAAERRRSLGAIAGLTRAQLSEHYSNCIRLNTENKINVKNAFSLQLIDCMADMLQRKDSELNNFQVASATMDASAKIYGYRVDVVHGETLRMAGGLGRTDDKRRGDDNQADPDADGDVPGAVSNKKRKGRRRKTVEQNVANINQGRAGQDAAAVSGGDGMPSDPILRRLQSGSSGGTDDGRGGTAVFQATLSMRCDGQQLMMDGQDGQPDDGQSDRPADDKLSATPQQLPTAPEVADLSVCAAFGEFSFSGWSLSEERQSQEDEAPFSAAAPGLPPRPDARHRFDVNAIPDAIVEDDEDMFHDMGDDYGCGSPGGGDADQAEPSTAPGRPCCRPAVDSTALIGFVTAVPQEYSYFDPRRVQTWAGPKHWKLPPSAGQTAAGRAQPGDRATRKGVKKEQVQTDYDQEVDFLAMFSVSKKSIKLKPITMKKWDEERTTLPEDLHYKLQSLFRTYMRPDIGFISQQQTSGGSPNVGEVNMDDSVASYDYDNDRDTAEYCTSVPPEEGADEYGDQEATFLPSGGADASDIFSCTIAPTPSMPADLMGDNLVEAPKKVERIVIPYAKTAKKMDMRRLKATVWTILTDNNDGKENGILETPVRAAKCDSVLSMTLERQYSFRELYHRLPTRLSTKMASNLSVALAFTALLHTANERCLKILQQGTRLDDVFVLQDI